MANTRALATAGLLLTLASGTSIATSPQDMAAQAKSCKALADEISSGLIALIIFLATLQNLKNPR